MTRALLAALTLLGTMGPALAAGPAPTDSTQVDWTGFYAGIHGGYGAGTFAYTDPGDTETIPLSGAFVGGQAGYNFVLGSNMVVGVQIDGAWSNQSGTFTDPSIGLVDHFRTDYSGSATAHVGVALGALMPYVLGGVALAHGTENYASMLVGNGSSSAVQLGLTAGIGAEARFADNLSGFLEARYTAYRASDFNGTGDNGPYTLPARELDWSVRTGLNWHF